MEEDTALQTASSGQCGSPKSSPIADLLERVKAASGPDRGLDDAILEATNPHRNRGGPYTSWRAAAWAFCWDTRITASLDAALALVERVLPGSTWSVGNRSRGAQAYMMRAPGLTLIGGNAPTPALALLAALIQALIAKGEREDG